MTAPEPTTLYRTPDGWIWVQQPDKPPHGRRYEWLLGPDGFTGWHFSAPAEYILEHHGPMTPMRLVVADEADHADETAPTYAEHVNAPLRPETIAAIRARLANGTMPRRHISKEPK